MTPEEFEIWQQYHRDDEAAQKLEMWKQFLGCIGAQEDAEVRALQHAAEDEAAQKLEMWKQFLGCIGVPEDAEVRALQHAAEAEIRKFQEHFPDVVRGLRSVQLQHKDETDFKSRFGTDAEFLRQCGIAPIE